LNGLSSGHECDRQTTDRQTDRATETYVGIGGNTCTAGAIPSDNNNNSNYNYKNCSRK